jgi:hypothetical protein
VTQSERVLSSRPIVLAFAMSGPLLVASLAAAEVPIGREGDLAHTPTIAWTAAPGCPEGAVLRSRVERLIGRALRDGDEAVAVTAEVTRGENFALELRVRSDTGVRERTITASSCDELVEIAAVVIAVAVDPSASLMPALEPEPAPPPDPVVPAKASTSPTPVRVAPRGNPRRRPGGTLQASAGVGLGMVPGPTAAVGGGGGVRWAHARVDLGLEHYVTRTARADDGSRGVDVRALIARAQGCWVPTAGRVVEFPLCAGFAAGAVHGRGFGVPRGDSRRAAWIGLHAQVGLWIAPLAGRRWFAFGPMVRVQAPLVRPAFALDGFGVLYRTKAASLVAGLAVELRFP